MDVSEADQGLPRMPVTAGACDDRVVITSFAPTSGDVLDRTLVAEAMTGGVISCGPETPLREVARLMVERRVHAIYVFADEPHGGGALWGLVSDLDLVAAARGALDGATARDAAVTPLVSVRSDDSLDRAAQQLAENGISHLAVIDPLTGRPVGVLSTLDIAAVIAGGSRVS